MAEGDRSKRGWVYAVAAAVGVVLIGLGVGIGALVWSGDSSAEEAAPALAAPSPVSAAETPTSKNHPKPGVKNYNVGATIYFSGLPAGGVTMNLTENPDSNCTKDQTLGDFPVTNATEQGISMRVKSDFDEGSCFWEASWNTWNVSLPGGGGQVELVEQRTGGAESVHWYEAWCQGQWTGGWSCSDDSDLGRAGYHKFWIKKS